MFLCNPAFVFIPAGGPAKGNPDQLPDSGGLFRTGFIKNIAELIKACIIMNVQGKGGVERTANTGQDPRQEEGIPSPSSQFCLMRRGVREHPCLFSKASETCCKNLTYTPLIRLTHTDRHALKLTKRILKRC